MPAEIVPIHPLELRRRGANLSREGLAARSGVGSTTIYEIEREGRSPSRSAVRLLAEALGCRPAEIVLTYLPKREETDETG